MSQISIEPKPKWKLSAFFLIVLAFSAALSVTMRVFSFYALPHYQKVLAVGGLGLVFSLLLLRFVHSFLSARSLNRNRILFTALIVLVVTAVVMVLMPYHQTPIRTLHTLTIVNPSSQTDLVIDKIRLPGDELLDFQTEFPDAEVVNDNLILSQGESLTYTREMAGGLDVVVLLDRPGVEAELYWDGIDENISLPDNTDIGGVEVFSMPGWSWGEPSLLYRALGWVNIFTDFVSLTGILFIGVLWLMDRKSNGSRSETPSPIAQALLPFTIPILISFSMIVVAGINQFWGTGRILHSFALILAGYLSFVPYILTQRRKWIIPTAFALIALSILFNFYSYLQPINGVPLTLSVVPDNSLATLAQKAGDSTYFSMGFYRYLRDADLHIPADQMEALHLYTDRLEIMNIGLQVIDAPYDYLLDKDLADQLLENFTWQAWPRETGGTYYLSLDFTNPGDALYFFASGDRYFLISDSFINESGIMDVSILN